MADAPDSAPAADTGRQKKCVLVPFGGKSQLDANRRLFEWCAVHLMDAADDVFVFHHTRRRKSGMAALRAATTQRTGVSVVNIGAASTPGSDKGSDAAAATNAAGGAFADTEWLPVAVVDAMRKRLAADPSADVAAFEVDPDAGFAQPEDAVAAISRGAFEIPPPAMHDALVVPRPDLVCVGSRGNKALGRAMLGSVSSATLAASAVPVCVFRASLPSPSEEELAVRAKLGDADQRQRAVCLALSGSDASHSVVEFAVDKLLRPSDNVIILHCDAPRKMRRRGLSDEHVSANLRACEERVRAFLALAPDPRGGVHLIRAEEPAEGAADVRDRMLEFLDKTDVELLVLGRTNRRGAFKTWTLGTVPMYAVTHGKCPVLVVN